MTVEERNDLLVLHHGEIERAIRTVCYAMPQWEREDLAGDLRLLSVKITEKYDATRGTDYLHFMWDRIRFASIDLFRKSPSWSRHYQMAHFEFVSMDADAEIADGMVSRESGPDVTTEVLTALGLLRELPHNQMVSITRDLPDAREALGVSSTTVLKLRHTAARTLVQLGVAELLGLSA